MRDALLKNQRSYVVEELIQEARLDTQQQQVLKIRSKVIFALIDEGRIEAADELLARERDLAHGRRMLAHQLFHQQRESIGKVGTVRHVAHRVVSHSQHDGENSRVRVETHHGMKLVELAIATQHLPGLARGERVLARDLDLVHGELLAVLIALELRVGNLRGDCCHVEDRNDVLTNGAFLCRG